MRTTGRCRASIVSARARSLAPDGEAHQRSRTWKDRDQSPTTRRLQQCLQRPLPWQLFRLHWAPAPAKRRYVMMLKIQRSKTVRENATSGSSERSLRKKTFVAGRTAAHLVRRRPVRYPPSAEDSHCTRTSQIAAVTYRAGGATLRRPRRDHCQRLHGGTEQKENESSRPWRRWRLR